MLKILTKNIVTAIILLSSISAFSYFNPVNYAKFQGYNGDGSFVETPANVGNYFGYIIAILPAEIITEPQRILNYDIQSDELGAAIMTGSTKTFGAIFGGPSFGLKAVFYDFPIVCGNLLIGESANSNESNKKNSTIISQKPLTDNEKKALGMTDKENKKSVKNSNNISKQNNLNNQAEPPATPNDKTLNPTEMKDLGISYKKEITPAEEKEKQLDEFAEDENNSSSWSQPSLPEWINETPNSSNK